MHMWACTHLSTYVKVRGQLTGVCTLLPCCGCWGGTQAGATFTSWTISLTTALSKRLQRIKEKGGSLNKKIKYWSWRDSEEHWLLFLRTWVWIPAPTWRLRASVTTIPEVWHLFWSRPAPHACGAQTSRQETPPPQRTLQNKKRCDARPTGRKNPHTHCKRKRWKTKHSLVVQACDPSVREWVRRIASSKPAWAIEWAQGYPEKFIETTSQN